jgi:hypothetical protein
MGDQTTLKYFSAFSGKSIEPDYYGKAPFYHIQKTITP